jgi:predicted AAA+ superfamily ATPase
MEVDLKKWKNDSKMPLMLVGARQVDKTYVLENFCKENYEKKYINLDKEENISQIYNPKYSIRISGKNFGFDNNIKSVPLYAVFCINK